MPVMITTRPLLSLKSIPSETLPLEIVIVDEVNKNRSHESNDDDNYDDSDAGNTQEKHIYNEVITIVFITNI